jgi:hypothetical protein
MGNALVEDKEHPEQIDRAAGANLSDLSRFVDTSAFLSPKSDVVAHLVLAHQTQMHNLITLTNYQTRIAAYRHASSETWEKPAEELLRYLLFTDEAQLTEKVTGDSGFAQEFAALGPRDSRGRSLRDFDLEKRIFRYPCSYLIYSEAFDSIPEPAKSYVYHRLLNVLTSQDQASQGQSAFQRLSAEDRQAVLEILLATKQGLPAEWDRYRRPSSAYTAKKGQ